MRPFRLIPPLAREHQQRGAQIAAHLKEHPQITDAEIVAVFGWTLAHAQAARHIAAAKTPGQRRIRAQRAGTVDAVMQHFAQAPNDTDALCATALHLRVDVVREARALCGIPGRATRATESAPTRRRASQRREGSKEPLAPKCDCGNAVNGIPDHPQWCAVVVSTPDEWQTCDDCEGISVRKTRGSTCEWCQRQPRTQPSATEPPWVAPDDDDDDGVEVGAWLLRRLGAPTAAERLREGD